MCCFSFPFFFSFFNGGRRDVSRTFREQFCFIVQCRSKGNISGGARKCWSREPLGGSGGMLPQKKLKSRDLEMLFPAFSKSYL